jgi:hypothetical protein
MVRAQAATAAVSALVLLCFAGAAAAQRGGELRTIPVRDGDTPEPLKVNEIDIQYGGYVKLDALYSVFSDGDVATPGGLRDFYAPSAIPVAGSSAAEDEHSFLDVHAKETRFFFKMDAHLAGARVGGYLEMDFISNPGTGTEVVTNAYNPALRRAFLTYNNWLFGQDWSTFQGLQSLPDTIDFVRWPTDGTVFSRQPLVRYTLPGFLGGDWQFALENAETLVRPRTGTVSGATPVNATFVSGDAVAPDVVVRYNWKPSFGDFSVALLGRELRADNAATGGDAPNNTAHGTTVGLGASIAGKVPVFGKDDVRFMVTAGEGIGRYVALGAAPDAVVANDNGLEAIPVMAGFVAYRHVWSPRRRSSAMVSTFNADNDTALTGSGQTSSLASARINLMYSPVEKLTFGAELTHAVRELENGEDGTMQRLQFSAMYAY